MNEQGFRLAVDVLGILGIVAVLLAAYFKFESYKMKMSDGNEANNDFVSGTLLLFSALIGIGGFIYYGF